MGGYHYVAFILCCQMVSAQYVTVLPPSARPAESWRLVNGTSPNEGRVELFTNGHWYTVCEHFFDADDAHVVCWELGYSGVAQVYREAEFGEGSSGQPIIPSLKLCHEGEDYMIDCSPTVYGTAVCSHSGDVGVECLIDDNTLDTFDSLAAEGSARLVDGRAVSEGRVEIFRNGEWGTVCDDSWNYEDATVVCRQLGYEDATESTYTAGPGPEHLPIHLAYVDCDGTEKTLSECGTSFHISDCDHDEDASVRCLVDNDLFLAPRLANGPTDHEGRVEIWTGEQWEILCDYIGREEIEVICQQLGHQSDYNRSHSNIYGLDEGRQSNYTIYCHGEEEKLSECRHYIDTSLSYGSCNTVAISCEPAVVEAHPTWALIGLGTLLLPIMLCCCLLIVLMCKKKKPRRETTRPTDAVFSVSAQTTNIQIASTIRPPPTAPALPTNYEWDLPPSYNEVVTESSLYPSLGGYQQ